MGSIVPLVVAETKKIVSVTKGLTTLYSIGAAGERAPGPRGCQSGAGAGARAAAAAAAAAPAAMATGTTATATARATVQLPPKQRGAPVSLVDARTRRDGIQVYSHSMKTA